MSVDNRDKLNRLLANWPRETVKTSKILVENGYSHQLLKKYVESGWIDRVGVGAFSRAGDGINWLGGLYAMQTDLQLPVHLGGLSALNYHGLGQYVMFNEVTSLFNTSHKKDNLPEWFKHITTDYQYYQHHLFNNEHVGLVTQEIEKITITLSTAERALLECLSLVPNELSYEHMYQLVENAQLLDPGILQKLLEDCRSIKVKRLFLLMADQHQLPCFAHLRLGKIELGSGKRKIGEGGCYHKKYQISVPCMPDELNEDGP